MPPRFDTLGHQLDAKVDFMFGSPLRIEPMAGGRIASASADPDRPVRTVVGVFGAEPVDGRIMADRREGRSAIGATAAVLPGTVITLSASVAAGLGYALRDGDHIVIDPATQPRPYRVIGEPKVSERGVVTCTVALITTP